MGVVIALMGVMLALGIPALRTFMQQQRADRSTDAIMWQITVARSYAIRTGTPIDLVVDKSKRTLTVQDQTDKKGIWSVLDLGGNGLSVDSLNLDLAESKLTFSYRGFCLNCGSTSFATVSVYAGGRKRQISVGFLGKAERLKS